MQAVWRVKARAAAELTTVVLQDIHDIIKLGARQVRSRRVVQHRALPVGCGFYFFLGFRFLCGTGTPAGALLSFSLNFW